jgi:hypothetical protein
MCSRVNKTPHDQQRLRRECINLRNDSNSVDCEYRKLITDIETRWNSTMFLLKSVHQMRPALQSIKEETFEEIDKTDGKLKQLIQSQQTIDIIEQTCQFWRNVPHCLRSCPMI